MIIRVNSNDTSKPKRPSILYGFVKKFVPLWITTHATLFIFSIIVQTSSPRIRSRTSINFSFSLPTKLLTDALLFGRDANKIKMRTSSLNLISTNYCWLTIVLNSFTCTTIALSSFIFNWKSFSHTYLRKLSLTPL